MFAEIVPEQLRSAVYAFDRSFEGAVGATAAPLVGLVAEKVFGYAGSLGGGVAQDAALVLANARALGNSMLILLLVPWGLDFFFYCGKACSICQLPLVERIFLVFGQQLHVTEEITEPWTHDMALRESSLPIAAGQAHVH